MNTKPDASYIGVTEGQVTSFVGKDAVSAFAVTTVISAIRLYLRTGIKASRMHTPKAMRDFATRTTGKTYPSSQAGLQQAMDDLTKWRDEMRAALPVIDNKTGEQL